MSTALYRRYRPETFEEVVGQEHVTVPLMAALEGDRTNHAYLFSGPRGCGKTTSARILARCLNCAEGPTATPCGECESCVELSRGGSGSLDVVEMDAASHGGVDDARELRERASFAPLRDRYKVFIIDEAHMVSNQGFNALLKLVEEPPPHVKFIFATTEPEKVIGTIRSRTHHYPFRLVPPGTLEEYLADMCRQEGVEVAEGVLPLVVRAGTGSVRDSLSVLDQLIGGATDKSLDYDTAVSLLGYTDGALLDRAVDAIADVDGGELFTAVGNVVESGHDPRRFVEDLLERLRDLVVLSLVGESARTVLSTVPEDQLARMANQAERLGAQRASRCADLTNKALSDMVGATSPRLQLELLCARLLLASNTAQATQGGAPVASVADARAAARSFGKKADTKPEPAAQPQAQPAAEETPAPVKKEKASTPSRVVPPADPVVPPAETMQPVVPQAAPPTPQVPEPPQVEKPVLSVPSEPVAAEPEQTDDEKLAVLRGMWREAMADHRVPPGTSDFIRQHRGEVSVTNGELNFNFHDRATADLFVAERRADGLEAVFSEKLGKALTVNVGVVGAIQRSRETNDDQEGDSRPEVASPPTSPAQNAAQINEPAPQPDAEAPSVNPARPAPSGVSAAQAAIARASARTPEDRGAKPATDTYGNREQAHTPGGYVESYGSPESPVSAPDATHTEPHDPEPTPPDEDEYGDLPTDLPDIVMEDFPAPPPAAMPAFPAPPPRSAPTRGGPAVTGKSAEETFSRLAEHRSVEPAVPVEHAVTVENEAQLVSVDDPLALEAHGIGLEVVLQELNGTIVEELEEEEE